jgi:hypothetical protein
MSAPIPLHVTAASLPPSYFRPSSADSPTPCLNVVAFYQGASYPFRRAGYGSVWVRG